MEQGKHQQGKHCMNGIGRVCVQQVKSCLRQVSIGIMSLQ